MQVIIVQSEFLMLGKDQIMWSLIAWDEAWILFQVQLEITPVFQVKGWYTYPSC